MNQDEQYVVAVESSETPKNPGIEVALELCRSWRRLKKERDEAIARLKDAEMVVQAARTDLELHMDASIGVCEVGSMKATKYLLEAYDKAREG